FSGGIDIFANFSKGRKAENRLIDDSSLVVKKIQISFWCPGVVKNLKLIKCFQGLIGLTSTQLKTITFTKWIQVLFYNLDLLAFLTV
mgnify:CR=1